MIVIYYSRFVTNFFVSFVIFIYPTVSRLIMGFDATARGTGFFSHYRRPRAI